MCQLMAGKGADNDRLAFMRLFELLSECRADDMYLRPSIALLLAGSNYDCARHHLVVAAAEMIAAAMPVSESLQAWTKCLWQRLPCKVAKVFIC